MRKYKLLKDLSTWKAGDIFILKENGHLYRKDEGGILVFIFKTLEKFGILENKEWFEEIPEEPI